MYLISYHIYYKVSVYIYITITIPDVVDISCRILTIW